MSSPKHYPFEDIEPTEEEASTSLGDWAMSNKPKRNPRAGIPASSMEKALKEAAIRSESNDWEGAKPLVFVALYTHLHEHVYDISPMLSAQERRLASFAVGRMLKKEFEDNTKTFVEFFRWVWTRESDREKWRRKNNSSSSFRITWRLMFSNNYLADWYAWQKRSVR